MDTKFIVHVAGEALVIGSLFLYFKSKISYLEERVKILEEKQTVANRYIIETRNVLDTVVNSLGINVSHLNAQKNLGENPPSVFGSRKPSRPHKKKNVKVNIEDEKLMEDTGLTPREKLEKKIQEEIKDIQEGVN